MKTVVICGDSRVRALSTHLRDLRQDSPKYKEIVISVPGATISRITSAIYKRYKLKTAPTQIYMMAGICDLTTKVGHRNLKPAFRTKVALMDHMIQEYTHAYDTLSQITKSPVICELVGMDLEKYCGHSQNQEYQRMMDGCIPELNAYIHHLNNQNGGKAVPRSANYIHKSRHGKKSARYGIGMTDGVHYNEEYSRYVAARLSKCITENWEEHQGSKP